MPQEDEEIVESYTVGQEYFMDTPLVPVDFELVFRIAAEVQNATIQLGDQEVVVVNHGNHLIIHLTQNVPEKLFNAWHEGDSGASQWVMGYVEKVMLPLNEELQRQRHHFGNPFIRSFSVFDISQIRIVDRERGLGVHTPPPVAVSNFPFFEIHPSDFLERVYIKDFIDAYYAYFSYTFDECIRKVVTSLECFFKFHKLKLPAVPKSKFPLVNWVRRKFRGVRFVSLVKTHITSRCELSEKNVGEELIKAYKIRNSIVHDGVRYQGEEFKKMAFDALHFLMDAYKFYQNDKPLNEFASGVEMQFLAHTNLVGQGVTIDFLMEDPSDI